MSQKLLEVFVMQKNSSSNSLIMAKENLMDELGQKTGGRVQI